MDRIVYEAKVLETESLEALRHLLLWLVVVVIIVFVSLDLLGLLPLPLLRFQVPDRGEGDSFWPVLHKDTGVGKLPPQRLPGQRLPGM